MRVYGWRPLLSGGDKTNEVRAAYRFGSVPRVAQWVRLACGRSIKFVILFGGEFARCPYLRQVGVGDFFTVFPSRELCSGLSRL